MSELRKYLSQMLDEDEVSEAIEIHERQLEEAREAGERILKYLRIEMNRGKYPSYDFKNSTLYKDLKNKLKEKGDE